MLKTQRQNEIINILLSRTFASVSELSALLYASESSIRRDLCRLEGYGIVRRSHGGAEIMSRTSIMPFGARSYDSVTEKNIIAKKALSLIKEGDIIFLDQSSTAYFLASVLGSFKTLTIVTNNIEIVSLLSKTHLTVYSSGGVVSKSNPTCLVGGMAAATFSRFNADIAFFSVGGVLDFGDLTDFSLEEIYTREAMLRNARKKVFLCNGEKVGRETPYVQCNLADIDTVITEGEAFDKFRDKFQRLEII